GDGRGWAAVALTRLDKTAEAAKLAAGPDGQTPCGYQTLRYVAHACAKVGAVEAAYHLSRLQMKCGRTKYITAGSRVFQSTLESSALYLQSTAEQMPKLLAGHGARVSQEIESLLEIKNDILALTPNRRSRMLTEAFNQLIRWYGRARLVPQAIRACEIMNELGVPRNDMTLHFLSRGCAQQYSCLKKAGRYTQAPQDMPGHRPEVLFIGRTNSGKSSMINALFSSLTKFAPASKTRAFTRKLHFYEVNRERAGLPHFMLVDSPGLGCADIPNAAKITREFPNMIFEYLRNRNALKHIFHLVDARNHKLLPADKQLLHLVAKAQRRSVRYTIVITKIDVCKRKVANSTAQRIREELAPYCDVDIMFASARALRGVDHLWSKIWQSVTETPRGRRHRDIGRKELERLNKEGPNALKAPNLSELLEIPDYQRPQDFDEEDFEE
ncbi:engB, partial [Symbiodinium sp. CCMP2456]